MIPAPLIVRGFVPDYGNRDRCAVLAVWRCYGPGRAEGCGLTPKEAYDDWLEAWRELPYAATWAPRGEWRGYEPRRQPA